MRVPLPVDDSTAAPQERLVRPVFIRRLQVGVELTYNRHATQDVPYIAPPKYPNTGAYGWERRSLW